MATAAGCRVILLKHLTAKECPYGHPDWVITPRRAGVLVAEIELEEVLTEVLRVIHNPQSQPPSESTVHRSQSTVETAS